MGELHRISTKAMLAALCPYKRRWRGATPAIKTRVLGALMMRDGKICLHQDIIEAVYGDDPEGGAIKPRRNIAIQVMRLRRRGYPIETHWGLGYSLRAG